MLWELGMVRHLSTSTCSNSPMANLNATLDDDLSQRACKGPNDRVKPIISGRLTREVSI